MTTRVCPQTSRYDRRDGDLYIGDNPENEDADDYLYYVAGAAGGGAVLNEAIDWVFDEYGGGRIHIENGMLLDTDPVTPNLTTDLIIEGNGHRKGAGTLGQARLSRSYLELSGGAQWTNALGAECNGRLIFKNLGIILNGLTNTYGFDMEYTPFKFEDCLLTDFNCTFASYLDAFICQTATPAPEAGMSEINGCDFGLSADNAVGIFAHKEVLGLGVNHVSFNGADQTFWMVSHPELPPGRGSNTLDHLECWFGADAEGCAVFRVFNAAKCVGIDSICIGAQAGAGATAFNVIFGLRAGQTWDTIVPAYVVTKFIDGPFLWGIPPGAVGNYLWQSGDAQERTSFGSGSQFGGTVIKPPKHTFICDSTAETAVNPGVSPGAAFSANLMREVDLRLVTRARVTARAQGNQALGNKGVNIYDLSTGAILCDTGTWAGNAVTYLTGPWTNVTANALRNCLARGYTDLGVETISCWVAELETR